MKRKRGEKKEGGGKKARPPRTSGKRTSCPLQKQVTAAKSSKQVGKKKGC